MRIKDSSLSCKLEVLHNNWNFRILSSRILADHILYRGGEICLQELKFHTEIEYISELETIKNSPKLYLRKEMSVTACPLWSLCSVWMRLHSCVISCELACVAVKDVLRCFTLSVSAIIQCACRRKNFRWAFRSLGVYSMS